MFQENSQSGQPLSESRPSSDEYDRYLLTMLMESVPDHIYFKDRQSRFVRVNRAVARLFGLNDPADIAGKTDFDFFAEEHAHQAYEDEQEVIRTGQPLINKEEKETWPDGHITWVSTTKMPLRDSEGNIIGTFGISRNITSRKLAQEELRQSDERFRLLVEQVKDYAIFMLDPEGHVASWNAGAQRIKGYSADDIIGKHFSTFYMDEARELGIPDEELKIAVREGRFEDEGWRVRKDGSRFWANVVITPLFDNAGQLYGFAKVTRDLTNRKEAEEEIRRLNEDLERRVIERTAQLQNTNRELEREIAERQRIEDELRRSRDELDVILRGVADGISVQDASGKVIYINDAAARVMGYASPEEFYAAPPGAVLDRFDMYDEARRPIPPEALPARRVLQGMESPDLVICWRVKHTGKEQWSVIKARPVYDRQGRVQLAINIFEDITERKRVEEEIRQLNLRLQQANSDLEAFAYSVSHDLQAPLRAISGFTAALVDEYGAQLDSTAHGYVARVQANARHMNQLILDLLAFARMGRHRMLQGRVDIGRLATEVFEELGPTNRERAIRLDVKPVPPARADKAMLQQVLQNLLTNAIKFTRPRDVAVIEVGGYSEGAENVYYVKDNGVGFDSKYTHKLFGVFQRLHTSDEFEGTGVGLAIVQRAIQHHGGRVWAESKLGEGATFFFTLPAGKE